MKVQEPPIFTASYDLARRIFQETMGFPKSQRFVIAQRLQNAALDVLQGVVSAYTKREKKASLEQASEALEQVRILIRLAHDLGFLPQKKADPIQQSVDEIGRMLGGWIKAEQKG